ncbi:palmitoyl-protein thioesterase [Exophiala viscosa]|uniref:palmitoyl-protein thioesterase n=1 Tax=Exophiala viscosa TaxID=2486360 RepID=UPI0021930071|nr:palmitoyl-protein thioesterase [Exophiala viscosa]
MQLRQLTALLSLPTAILSFVVFPEAEVFQTHSEDLSLALTLPVPKYVEFIEAVHPEQRIQITRLSPEHVEPTEDLEDTDDQPLPVVIWHGLGDSADNKGLKEVAELIDSVHPGTYTYIISVVGGAGSADRQASFFGNVTEQLESVCHALAEDNILKTAPAVDAIGFSQGGQFLRGYVERCGGWAPKVRSLITFGSQHNGIAEFQKCKSTTDWVCQGANALLKSSTVWSDFVQSRLVPAQYYRDTNDFENYLNHSNFLADINNERKVKNATYAQNIAALEKLVMVVFDEDRTVIPKESGWFAEVNLTSASVTQLKDRPIYMEDWIGLKKLDEKGGLDFLALPGEHMNFSDKDLKALFARYFGPSGRKFEKPSKEDGWKLEL